MSDLFEELEKGAKPVEGEVKCGAGIHFTPADESIEPFDLFCNRDKHKGMHFGMAPDGETYGWVDTIYLTGELTNPEGISATCTCGWGFGPSTKVAKIGKEVMNHAKEEEHLPRGMGEDE